MYVAYFTYRNGQGIAYNFGDEYPVVPRMRLRPSECIWIVPGTVSPLDD